LAGACSRAPRAGPAAGGSGDAVDWDAPLRASSPADAPQAHAARAAALAPEALALADRARAAGQVPVAAAALRVLLAGARALPAEALAAVLPRCTAAGLAAEAAEAAGAAGVGAGPAALAAALLGDAAGAGRGLRRAGLLAQEALWARRQGDPLPAQQRWEARLGAGLGGLPVALVPPA